MSCRAGLVLALIAAQLVVPPAACAADPVAAGAALERSVKAAFLFKFLGYTEFPPAAFGDATTPVTIGVIGADELAQEVERLVSGRLVHNRPIAVRTLREGEASTGVHLIFIGGFDSARVARVLKALPAGPVLLVTEAEQGLQHGSVINFKLIDERVRFDVALAAAERNSVRLSSRLLTVAHVVMKEGP
jgi:hypothetical protein